MTTMTREKVLTLLSKLDALAAQPGTPHEGANARRRAAAIREKHAALLVPVRVPQPMVFVPSLFGFGVGGGAVHVSVTFIRRGFDRS